MEGKHVEKVSIPSVLNGKTKKLNWLHFFYCPASHSSHYFVSFFFFFWISKSVSFMFHFCSSSFRVLPSLLDSSSSTKGQSNWENVWDRARVKGVWKSFLFLQISRDNRLEVTVFLNHWWCITILSHLFFSLCSHVWLYSHLRDINSKSHFKKSKVKDFLSQNV